MTVKGAETVDIGCGDAFGGGGGDEVDDSVEKVQKMLAGSTVMKYVLLFSLRYSTLVTVPASRCV